MALIDHMKALRVACVVAASGSSVNAANVLHLSQSSVTRAVQRLEAELQQVLFYRSGLGMQPTAQCSAILKQSIRAFQQLAMPPEPDWMRCRVALGMGPRHIRVMLSLSVTGSETLSAAQLGISQSAVHQTLAQLEHLSNGALFVRSRQHGLHTTDHGALLLRACKMCLSELAHADELLAALTGTLQGRLIIGTLPFSTGALLPKAVDRLMRAMPGIEVTVIDGTYDALIHQLRHGEIDLMVGALRQQLPVKGLVQETLFVDRLAVVARAGHPLSRRKNLSWRDLRDALWIMPMPNTPAQAVLEQVLAGGGLPMPAVELRVNSALMMQALLMQSERLAMMSPRQIQGEIQAGLLVELPLPLAGAARTIGLLRRADRAPSTGLQMLLDNCRLVAAEIAGETLINKSNA